MKSYLKETKQSFQNHFEVLVRTALIDLRNLAAAWWKLGGAVKPSNRHVGYDEGIHIFDTFLASNKTLRSRIEARQPSS